MPVVAKGSGLRGSASGVRVLSKPTPTPVPKIPIFIIVRDRITSLRRLVERLEDAGQERIILIDNSSSYPPLLEYLSSCRHKVVRTGRNDGPSSPWTSRLVRDVPGRFVVTDPDLYPAEDCPRDFMAALNDCLTSLAPSGVVKVGMGLRIDDLPSNPVADSVRKWEAKFWSDPIGSGSRGETWYRAPVDTTFALYLPHQRYDAGCASAARLGDPYLLRCDPWYEDPAALSEEERYYVTHASPSSNWATAVRPTE